MKRTAISSPPDGKGYNVILVCPWCSVTTKVAPNFISTAHEHTFLLVQCANCGRPVLLRLTDGEFHAVQFGSETVFADAIPSPQESYAPPGVPLEIAIDFQEALRCRDAGYYLGAALVGRRVLQAAARHKVGELKNLDAEIDAAVPEPLRDAAHHVRLIGNEAAHADAIEKDEIDQLLDFTRQVLHLLFVLPHEVAKLTMQRAARGAKVPKPPKP